MAKDYIHQHVLDAGAPPVQETTEDIAHLLTEMSEIASKELPTFAPPSEKEEKGPETPNIIQKARAVSLCSPDLRSQPSPIQRVGGRFEVLGLIGAVTPPQSPVIVRIRLEKSDSADRKNRPIQPLSPSRCDSTGSAKRVLHKKFSWKSYPQLEEFLLANRDEYLRHSTLNYTIQQKKYNNQLTERMLELAADCGYVFDEESFSFVTVRDRIRCYYKSYVQSLKKRGIVIGYAARKAGLVTDKDLEVSANTKGTFFTPSSG